MDELNLIKFLFDVSTRKEGKRSQSINKDVAHSVAMTEQMTNSTNI